MALEYEVRPEYRSLPLEKLLDNSVTCFEGVGNTQATILSRYFGVTTIRQLANMPFFLWALGIQEMALKPAETSGATVEQLSSKGTLKFSVRPNAMGKTPRDLLKGPVNVFEGLAPGQNLALYDGFRITNVIQLAHNRIMLEARVIEYLEKHGQQGAGGPDKAEVASILGADTFIPGSGDEAQQAMAAKSGGDRLHEMADEIGQHVRGRIDALRDSAQERARSFATREPPPAAAPGEQVGLRPERPASASSDRLSALREVRQRTETTRVQTTPTGPAAAASRAAAIAASRAGTELAAPPGGAPGAEAGAPSAGAGALPAGAGAPSAGAGALPAGAGAPSGGLATTPGMTIRPPATADEADAETFGAEGAPPDLTAELVEPEFAGEPRPAFKPWMAAAAVVLIVLIVAVWMLVGGGSEEDSVATAPPPPPPAVAETTPAGSGEPAPVAAPQQPVAVVQPPPPPAVAIKGVHQVRKGESLWRISRREYGRGALWPKIYDLNLDQIQDPDLIFPKQKFKLPEIE